MECTAAVDPEARHEVGRCVSALRARVDCDGIHRLDTKEIEVRVSIEDGKALPEPTRWVHRIAVALREERRHGGVDELVEELHGRSHAGPFQANRDRCPRCRFCHPFRRAVGGAVVIDEQRLDEIPVGVRQKRREGLARELEAVPGEIDEID